MNGLSCENCIHNDVCKLKSLYVAANKAVDNLMVHYQDSDRQNASIYLRSISWISAEVICGYFREDVTKR